MIAADDHRHDLSGRDLGDAGADRLVRLVSEPRVADGVAVVDDLEHLEGRHLEVEVPAGWLVIGDPYGARSKAGARPVGGAVVPRRAEDRDLGADRIEFLRFGERLRLHEGRGAQVLRAVDLGVEVGRLWHSPTILAAS